MQYIFRSFVSYLIWACYARRHDRIELVRVGKAKRCSFRPEELWEGLISLSISSLVVIDKLPLTRLMIQSTKHEQR
jgi:hypothetical protein